MQLIENFFNKDECDFAISEIMSYKNHWYNCAETDMFVLGNSLLRKQDFDKNGNKDYSNYLNSKDLYFKTLEIFKEKISKEFLETKFCSFLPKPGFQIINTSGSKNPAVWHYDDILTFYPYDVEFSDYKNLVAFTSLSKRSNVPGMRSGFVAGDANLLKQFLLYRTYHGSAMSGLVQAASIAAWSDEAHVVANRDMYRQKFVAVTPLLAHVLDVKLPDAAFYLWAAVPGGDDQAFAHYRF